MTVPSFATVLAKLPVDAQRAQKILQILLREQVLVRVTAELVFHRSAVHGCANCLRGIARRRARGCRSLHSKNLRASRGSMPFRFWSTWTASRLRGESAMSVLYYRHRFPSRRGS